MKQLTDEAYVLIREALKASINVPCYDGHPLQEAALAVLEASPTVSNGLRVTEDMVQGLKEANTLLDDITTKILDREERLHYLQNQNGNR